MSPPEAWILGCEGVISTFVIVVAVLRVAAEVLLSERIKPPGKGYFQHMKNITKPGMHRWSRLGHGRQQFDEPRGLSGCFCLSVIGDRRNRTKPAIGDGTSSSRWGGWKKLTAP